MVISMRIKLAIATSETDYSEHLSSYISQHYSDIMDVIVCSTSNSLDDALAHHKFDAALLEQSFIFEATEADLRVITLPLVLIGDTEEDTKPILELKGIRKYQRISSIVADLFEHLAKISKHSRNLISGKANITAFWSPSGGVGKTAVALAYAIRKSAEARQVLYLNLETFSSVPAYFYESGKSISTVFEMLESDEGDIKMIIRSICKQDQSVGVSYFCKPENFDDMHTLSADNIAELTSGCAGITEELVIDMSCACDWKARKIFELADQIMIVTDPSVTSEVKLLQFISQHNVFESISEKLTIIANKGAATEKVNDNAILHLPLITSNDPMEVCKMLSLSFEDI